MHENFPGSWAFSAAPTSPEPSAANMEALTSIYYVLHIILYSMRYHVFMLSILQLVMILG